MLVWGCEWGCEVLLPASQPAAKCLVRRAFIEIILGSYAFIPRYLDNYSTTICQTIEIGRISKDLKGFERILLDFNGIVRHVDRFFGT